MIYIWGILGLGTLVFFHELGHFIAARLSGVKVEAFSIGMGPVLLHKKIKETDYRISAIPLGGYCAMKGEKDFQYAIENGLTEIEADKDSFYGINPAKRLAIAFAGPFANLLIAFICFFTVASVGYDYYSAGCKVIMADETDDPIDSIAHRSGMQSGDEILSINGKKMNDFSDIAEFIMAHGDEDISVLVSRNEEKHTIKLHTGFNKDTGAGIIGIKNDISSIIKRSYKSENFFAALLEGAKKTEETAALTLKGILYLVTAKINVEKAVSGPGRITGMLGQTVQDGFNAGIKAGIVTTLNFIAFISISLFLTNLLPIPVLDGGLILFSLIEIIRRKKINPKTMYYIQIAGVAIIALLMTVAIGGDISYFIKK